MPKSESSSSRSPRSLRILYVDDDPRLRTMVAMYLRGQKHTVETASDGAEALVMLTDTGALPDESFDVMITDLNMPEMDGVALIRAVRKTELRIPIIVFSGFLAPERVADLAGLAIQATVPKGTRPGLLAETVIKVAESRG